MSIPLGGDVMQLSLEQSGDVRIVRVSETKLTYPVLSSFFARVSEIVVEGGARKLVIDLGAVTYIDSATIGCLMDIHHLLMDHGGVVKLSGLQPRVDRMLSMTGVHKVLHVYREEAEALAAFLRPRKEGGDAASHFAGAASAARSGLGTELVEGCGDS
jgi:anti-anti-sigma factor